MALNCEPSELLALSKCFVCMSRLEREAVKTYLLAVLAGGSLDPVTLLAAAKCFMCIDKITQKALQNYLLCQAVDACSDGGNGVACNNQQGAGLPT